MTKSDIRWSLFELGDVEWDSVVMALHGSCVYQSSHWARHRMNFGWSVQRMIARNEMGTPVVALQLLIKSAPGKAFIAWAPGAPLGEVGDIDTVFLHLLCDVLGSRLIYFRFSSMIAMNSTDALHLEQVGFHKVGVPIGAASSLILNTSSDESIRLDRCSSNWKRNLKRSSKHGATPYIWHNPSASEIASAYQIMDDYKKISSARITKNESEIRSVIDSFGNDLLVIRCNDADGSPLAIRAALIHGATAWDFMAIATPAGRKQYSSHATLWTMANACAVRGVNQIDLGGIDPVKNKGVFDFKHGTGAQMIDYLGEWEIARPSWIRGLASRIITQRVQ